MPCLYVISYTSIGMACAYRCRTYPNLHTIARPHHAPRTKKGPMPALDVDNETSTDIAMGKEFPSRFSPQEKAVRKVISQSLGTMAIMIVVIVLVGICLLDIPCERFCGDDKKSSSRGGWLCGCGSCKKKSRRRSSTHAGVVTTLTAPSQRNQRFAPSARGGDVGTERVGPYVTDANGAVLGLASGNREIRDLVSAASLSKSLSNIDEEDGIGLDSTAESVIQPGTPARGQNHVNLMGMSTPVRQRTVVSQVTTANGSTSISLTPNPQDALPYPNRYVSSITVPTPVVRQSSPSLLDTEIRKRQLRSGAPPFKPLTDGAVQEDGAAIPSSDTAQQEVTGQSENPLDSPLHRRSESSTHDPLEYPVLEPTRPPARDN